MIDHIIVWGFIIFFGFFALAYISFPTLLALILYAWLSKTRLKYMGIALVIIAPLYTAYDIYTAIYPTDSFYFHEYETVTLRKAPEGAKVLNKTASYPDFHGDYCSASKILLPPGEYERLLNELSADSRFTKNGELMSSSEFETAMGETTPGQISCNFTRPIPGEEDHYLYIGFLDDKRTIIVYICVT